MKIKNIIAVILVLIGLFYSVVPHSIHVSTGLDFGLTHSVHVVMGIIFLVIGIVVYWKMK